MRWQQLFADLEGQGQAWERADRDSEIADRTRAEVGQISLVGRLHAQLGQPVRFRIAGAGEVVGQLDGIGNGWLLLTGADEKVVVSAAVLSACNLATSAVAPAGIGLWSQRTRLTSVVRAIARDRSTVSVQLRDGTAVVGTPDRVGLDWVDLAVHERDEAPRRSAVRTRLTLPFDAISVISRAPSGWA